MTTRNAIVVSLIAALAFGCSALKRFGYEGVGRDEWQQPERVLAELREAGYEEIASHDFIEPQTFTIFRRKQSRE